MEGSEKGQEVIRSNPSCSTSQSRSELPRNPAQEESSAAAAPAKNDQVRLSVSTSSNDTGQEQEQNQTRTRYRQTAVPSRAITSAASPTYHQWEVYIAMLKMIPRETDPIHSMDARINDRLFTGSAEGRVIEWHKGEPVKCFRSEIHSGPVHAIALRIVDDSSFCVFVAHSKGIIRAWRKNAQTTDNFLPVGTLEKRCDYIKNRIFPWRQPHPSNMVRCLCLSDDHIFIYSGAADGTLNTWSIYEYKLVYTTRHHKGPVRALAVGPGVVFSGDDRGVIVMLKRERYGRTQDRVTHLVLGIFTVQNEMEPVHINSLQFGRMSPIRGWLYAGCSDGTVRCWKNLSLVNPKADEQVPEVMIHYVGEREQTSSGEITCLALSSGLLVFSGSTRGTICVWKRSIDEPHRLAKVLRAHISPVKCIAVQNAWNVNVNDNRPRKWVLYSWSENDGFLMAWTVEERRVQEGATGSGEATGSGGARSSRRERFRRDDGLRGAGLARDSGGVTGNDSLSL